MSAQSNHPRLIERLTKKADPVRKWKKRGKRRRIDTKKNTRGKYVDTSFIHITTSHVHTEIHYLNISPARAELKRCFSSSPHSFVKRFALGEEQVYFEYALAWSSMFF
jgi:hypothetical protein